MKRKICIVTGTRAEYGLLYWLIKEIQEDSELELQLIATGMHLSPEFGLTYRQIEKDGFKIDKKIEMLLSSDTPVGISKSMGLGMIGFAEAYAELKPDIIVLLGDRFEIFSAAVSAMIACIPIAHLHGGETTEGAFDEAIRHSITKMSHLHFTAAKEYKRRVIQLGESPDRVFNVGGLGIDNIRKLKLMNREEFEGSIKFKLGTKNLLITFHPVTLEHATAGNQFQNLLNALDELQDTKFIFTKPNADTEGRVIIKMIDDYVSRNSHKAIAFINLGQLRYLSALKFVDACVGNSSSGLAEAPTFKIGTINMGDRQRGRLKADNVIDCEPDKESILTAIRKLYSKEFQNKLKDVKNPYGEGGATEKIKKILKEVDLSDILKKEFCNIKIADKFNSSRTYEFISLITQQLKSMEGEKMEVTCFVKKEGSQYASLCVELDVASCGRTKKDALDGLKRAVETYIEYMLSEGREKEIYRPVPMNELKTFLFPEHQTEEKTLKAIPLSFQYA